VTGSGNGAAGDSCWRIAARLLPFMLLLSVAAATLAAATAASRPEPGRVQACGRAQALVAGPRTAEGYPAYVACLPLSRRGAESRLDPRYSQAASGATSTTTLAVCWSERDWAQVDAAAKRTFGEGIAETGGFVWEGQQVANLPPRLCRRLDRVVHERRLHIDRWTAWAFKNLTHEALHVAGVDDEAQTECFALQRMTETVTALGFDRPVAERLAALAWSRYQVLAPLQPRYFSPGCRNGGPLDLSPLAPRWPSG